MCRFLSVFLAAVITICLLPVQAMENTAFSDVSPDDWFAPYVEVCVEAGLMEGCRWWQVLFRVLLPMSWPSVLAFATVSITYHWNEYLWPLMMLNDPDKQVLTVGLVSFAMGAESGGQWGTIGAGTLMVCLPLMLAFILFQKQFLRSFGFSGIK